MCIYFFARFYALLRWAWFRILQFKHYHLLSLILFNLIFVVFVPLPSRVGRKGTMLFMYTLTGVTCIWAGLVDTGQCILIPTCFILCVNLYTFDIFVCILISFCYHFKGEFQSDLET